MHSIIEEFVPDADRRLALLLKLNDVKGNRSFETTTMMLLELELAEIRKREHR